MPTSVRVKVGSLFVALAAFAIASVACKPLWAAPCYDLAQGQPKMLVGTLDYVMFAGPPNFEDVQKGDTPEPAYVLRLSSPICIMGDEFADPNRFFRDVQVVETEAVAGQLKRFLHQRVSLTLKEPMAAETGHHHEPLVAWVTGISLASHSMEFIEEYGTAATAIRAFYAALRDGQGELASEMVVPEKRIRGPFSPNELTRFYGHLKDPITLIDIGTNGPGEYIVHYHYVAATRACDGRASIKTVVRDGRNYIQNITALNGC